jgi:hypothetical protein
MGNKGAFIHLDKTLKVLSLPRLILFCLCGVLRG